MGHLHTKIEMDPMNIKQKSGGDTILSTDGRQTTDNRRQTTDNRRQTDRQTVKLKPIYPPTTSLCGGYNKKRRTKIVFKH